MNLFRIIKNMTKDIEKNDKQEKNLIDIINELEKDNKQLKDKINKYENNEKQIINFEDNKEIDKNMIEFCRKNNIHYYYFNYYKNLKVAEKY